MTPSRYLVIQCGGAWAVRSGNRTFGPFSDHVHAIDAAIDYAEKDGKAGHPAKVSVQEDGRTLRTVWTYGRDPYPARQAILLIARPAGHIACHDRPVSDTATSSPAPRLLGRHRIRYRYLSQNLTEKNRTRIGLNLQELKRPQRRITNVANC